MENKSITFDGFTVHYGKTTVQELLDRGYTISCFDQILEEPVLAWCNLNKDNAFVATLSFWDIKEKISQEQLYDVPIDFVLHEEEPSQLKDMQAERQKMDSDFDFCENVNEILFRYTNEFYIIMLWFGFAVIGSLIFVLLGSANFDTWLINTFDLTGLIIYLVLALLLFVGLFCGSYFLAVKLTDRTGMAVFYDDYVEINMGEKCTRIYYPEILQMKYVDHASFLRQFNLSHLSWTDRIHNHTRLKIKCKDVKINIRSSAKELFELKRKDKKFFSQKLYRVSLRNVYDKIYFKLYSLNYVKVGETVSKMEYLYKKVKNE